MQWGKQCEHERPRVQMTSASLRLRETNAADRFWRGLGE